LPLTDHHINVQLLDYLQLLRVQFKNGRQRVLDPIRKKWLASQPEEIVRQLLILWLVNERKYPAGKLQVEKAIRVHSRSCRFDLVVYNQAVIPWMIVECKAPEVPITQSVFDQIATYNMALHAPYFLVTNGKFTYCAFVDQATKTWQFLADIPQFGQDLSG
jgi:hypothetical protein